MGDGRYSATCCTLKNEEEYHNMVRHIVMAVRRTGALAQNELATSECHA